MVVGISDESVEHAIYTERELSEMLDRLIEAWSELIDLPRREAAFRNAHQPPRAPRGFEDAKALAEHASAQARYRRQVEEAYRQFSQVPRRYTEATEEVAGVLPQGTAVTHDYQGPTEARRGRYLITHTEKVWDLRGVRTPIMISRLVA